MCFCFYPDQEKLQLSWVIISQVAQPNWLRSYSSSILKRKSTPVITVFDSNYRWAVVGYLSHDSSFYWLWLADTLYFLTSIVGIKRIYNVKTKQCVHAQLPSYRDICCDTSRNPFVHKLDSTFPLSEANDNEEYSQYISRNQMTLFIKD